MTVATIQNVTALYIALNNRAPDNGGLQYWLDAAEGRNTPGNVKWDLETICKSFFDQPEIQALYPADTSNADFILAAYQNTFSRNPLETGDEDGYNYWLDALDSGVVGRNDFIAALINGAIDTAENKDATLLNNQIEVGMYYAANGDEAPTAQQVIEYVNETKESVDACKQWIDDVIPSYATPDTYYILDDAKKPYDLTGSNLDDVFAVKKFASAKVDGGEGSDTVDFTKYAGITAGGVGILADLNADLGPNKMTLTSIENVRGTKGVDTINGDAGDNILVANGGADRMNAGSGSDRIIFDTIADIAASAEINGGMDNDNGTPANNADDRSDSLEISREADIVIAKNYQFANVSDIETLQVGFKKGDGNGETAATITMEVGSSFGTIKNVAGHDGFTDVIQAGSKNTDLDVSSPKLISIDTLIQSNKASTITVGATTLAGGVKNVIGAVQKDTSLTIKSGDGKTVDLSKTDFANIDLLAGHGTAAADTLIVNQSLVNSMAAAKTAGVGFDAGNNNWSESTLQASGAGLDLTVLANADYTGAKGFKAINFGTTNSVIMGTAKSAALVSITGSDGDVDVLTIKDANTKQDLTAITIKKVEKLIFEEVTTAVLDNDNLTDVKAIAGDTDGNVKTYIESAEAKGLDLTDTQLYKITGFEDGVFKIDLGTVWDSTFTSFGEKDDTTVLLMEAGSYDFSGIKGQDTDAKAVTVNNLATTDDVAADKVMDSNALTLNMGKVHEQVKGSTGDDIIKGSTVNSFYYELDEGNDHFIGGDKTNEIVIAGKGNDMVALGDNTADIKINDFSVVDPLFNLINVTKTQEGKKNDLATGDFVREFSTVDATGADVTKAGFADVFKDPGAYAAGGEGNDTITSGKGDDVLDGGAGEDSVSGGNGNDILMGGTGNDTLSGGAETDILLGGDGNDVIQGDNGEDYIYGGEGADVLRGDAFIDADGDGVADKAPARYQDHFHFQGGDSGATLADVDLIKDFYSYEAAFNDAIADGKTATAAHTVAAAKHDVIYLDWYADDKDAAVYNGAAALEALNVSKKNTDATVADNQAGVKSGVSYDTLFLNVDDSVQHQASLLAAANAALTQVYDFYGVKDLLKGGGTGADTFADYTSLGAQFEYAGKEYLAVNAYVNWKGLDQFEEFGNDLLIALSDSTEDWALTSDTDGALELVVTRWDTQVSGA